MVCCRLQAITDDLAVGEDRADGIAVSLEQPGDAQLLDPVEADAGVAHPPESWARLGTQHGQTGTAPSGANWGAGALANTIVCECFAF